MVQAGAQPRIYDPDGHAALPFTDPQLSLLTASSKQTDSDLLANVHLDAATPSRLPRQTSGHRLRLRFLHEIGGIKKPDNFAPE